MGGNRDLLCRKMDQLPEVCFSFPSFVFLLGFHKEKTLIDADLVVYFRYLFFN